MISHLNISSAISCSFCPLLRECRVTSTSGKLSKKSRVIGTQVISQLFTARVSWMQIFSRMYKSMLALLVTALCVDSLSVQGSSNIFVFNEPEQNEESNFIDVNSEPPPPHSEVAKMARYVVHNTDWSIVTYKSQQPKTNEFPMGTVLSVSDGPVGSGKGTPYVYVSNLEDVVQDTEKDSRCSFTMTLAEGDYCKQMKLDPQFPTCPQVTLIGRLGRVKNGTAEEAFAREALFSRHSSMKTWPRDHHFFFMKLDIERVMLLDYFGGPIYVDVDDYFDVKP